jgi:hypothetical protein
MAAGLLLEFEGVTQKDYETVNQKLGIDTKTGKGDWPAGMRNHTAGLSGDGVLIVTEVWDSEAHQERFMEQRLGPALQEAGLPAPTRMLWVDVLAHHQPS